MTQTFSIIIKNIIFIIIFSIIFMSGAFIISKYFINPTYISSIKLYVVSENSDLTEQPNINDLYYAQQVVNTYIEILKTNNFFTKIANETNLGYNSGELQNMVTFKILNNTEVFQIDVTAKSPIYAKFIAKSISINAPLQINGIKVNDTVKLVQTAELPISPSSPNIIINSTIGFFFGFTISILIVILREILDNRVKDAGDLDDKYNIPIFGVVPVFTFARIRKGGEAKGFNNVPINNK
ncbi:MAG: hypothetical protein K0S55_1039 [Clostridia bacterium]|nr:hypothetical protein [Clostridia bacterium]